MVERNQINSRFIRLNWPDFWSVFYSDIYSPLEQTESQKAKNHQPQYSYMVDYMANVIRSNKEHRTFYRSMQWYYMLGSSDFERSNDRYLSFLDQIQSGYFQFDRFVSGSLEHDTAWRYIDQVVTEEHKAQSKNKGIVNPRDFAAVLIKFDGPCCLLESIGTPLYKQDREVILDPIDQWRVDRITPHQNVDWRGDHCFFWEIEMGYE